MEVEIQMCPKSRLYHVAMDSLKKSQDLLGVHIILRSFIECSQASDTVVYTVLFCTVDPVVLYSTEAI